MSSTYKTYNAAFTIGAEIHHNRVMEGLREVRESLKFRLRLLGLRPSEVVVADAKPEKIKPKVKSRPHRVGRGSGGGIKKALAVVLAMASVCWADGPNLKLQTWLSNDTLYASVDLPACHYARFERTTELKGTNSLWLGADYAEEKFFTRRVVFRETMVFPRAMYRVRALYVHGCPTLR